MFMGVVPSKVEGTPRAEPPSPAAGVKPLDLSILIVTWNSERFIDRCLRSIPAACEGLAYEVVVHDNASVDDTLSHLRGGHAIGQTGPTVPRVLRSETNAGFAAGTNRAFDVSRGRYVFLLNPDCELAPLALTRLFEFMDAHAGIAAAVPLLIDESGDSQRDFQLRRLPSLGALATEVLLIDKLFPRNRTTARYRYRDLDLSHPQRIEQPAAAALLLRREVLEEIGPLDEQFAPAWFEDVDYCRRLAEHRKEVWAVPAAVVRHFGGASLEHIHFSGFVDIWYRNMWRYAKKWMSPGQAEALRWAIMAGMLLRFVAGVFGKRPEGISRGEAFGAYRLVLKRAFRKWDESRSSS
jgi:N-acetylglucosaminyl-diphospho-decaprenol L-rhamnosyltransferase